MGKKPSACPACGRTAAMTGPEPFRCGACGYTVTPKEDENDG